MAGGGAVCLNFATGEPYALRVRLVGPDARMTPTFNRPNIPTDRVC